MERVLLTAGLRVPEGGRVPSEIRLLDHEHPDREPIGPIEPVQMSGWYEHSDGTVGEYTWRDGRLDLDAVARDYEHVRAIRRQQEADAEDEEQWA